MFQMAISDKVDNNIAMDYFFDKISAPVKAAGGIAVKDSGKDRCYVSIASEADRAAPIKELISNLMCDIICNYYKAVYFKKNLKMDAPCLFNFSTLVKTLVAFDREGDRDIAKRAFSCDLPETLALDGFFNFRMTELKERWNTVIKLTAENALSLSNREVFLEFISFMLTTIETMHKTINIYKHDDGFMLADGQKKPIIINELLPSDGDIEEDLIASLIFFAPEKVIINFENGISKKTLSILNILFDTKTKAK